MTPVPATTAPHSTVPPALSRTASAAPSGWENYTVRRGDTLVDIAARTGTAPVVLAAQNQLPNGGRLILAGSVLQVPTAARPAPAAAPAPAATPAPGTVAAPAAFTTYTVRWGDTIGDIALRSPANARQIMAANGIVGRGRIVPGQVLRIPLPPATAPAPAPARASAGSPVPAPVTGTTAAGSTAYTVVRGDTLERITGSSGATLVSLITANALVAPYLLQVGQVLQVPVPAPPPAAPVPTFAGRTYPQATLDAAAANRAALAASTVPSRTATRDLVATTATRNGVDPRLALAVAYLESGWDQRQVSIANAVGTMQVIPSAGEWASEMTARKLDLLRAEDNVTAGVVILRALMRSAASPDEAIAGYYQGLASVRANGMYPDTVAYVAAVQALQSRL